MGNQNYTLWRIFAIQDNRNRTIWRIFAKMAPVSYGLSVTQAFVAQCFEIVCSVFFIGFYVYFFTETSHVVRSINVYGLEMSLSNFSYCIFGLLTVLSIFSLLSSLFFIFAATRSDGKQIAIYMFMVPLLEISSLALFLLLSLSSSHLLDHNKS